MKDVRFSIFSSPPPDFVLVFVLFSPFYTLKIGTCNNGGGGGRQLDDELFSAFFFFILINFKLYNYQKSDSQPYDYGQHVPSDVNH